MTTKARDSRLRGTLAWGGHNARLSIPLFPHRPCSDLGPEDAQSLNRYAYVGNDPVNSLDPLGLSRWDIQMPDGSLFWGGAGWGVGWNSLDILGAAFSVTYVNGDPKYLSEDIAGLESLINGPIGAALSRLRTLLSDDPNCLAFLNANKRDALQSLDTIVKLGLYGQEPLPPRPNPDGTYTITNAQSGRLRQHQGSRF